MPGGRRVGRPDALTADTEKKIVDAVRAGATLKDAAEHAGIAERTLHGWVERAQKTNAPAKFVQFSQALTRARADAKVGAIAVLRHAMREDWRAALAYLERRHPEEWARRAKHEVTGADGGPVAVQPGVDLSALPPEKLRALRELLAEADAGARSDA